MDYSSTINYWMKNKSTLSTRWLYSLKELWKYNWYLKFISKDIKDLSNTKKINSNIWKIYRQAQGYNVIFDNIWNTIEWHLKNISTKIYNKYIENKKNKVEKNKS